MGLGDPAGKRSVAVLTVRYENWAYLCWESLQRTQNHQLDGSSDVSFGGHGVPQGFHGVVVGTAEKGFAVDGDQLVVDTQTTVLQETDDDKDNVMF